jgi:hypothetical protein
VVAATTDVFDRLKKLQDGPNTLSGQPAGARAKVPADAHFGDKEYLSGTFAGAANLMEIGATLIGTLPELRFLEDSQIGYLWKKKGATRSGKPVMGEIKRVPPREGFYSELEWIVIIHAPHVTMLTNRQLEAEVYHELSHLMWDDENENIRLRGHDLEMFREEVDRYGLWTPDLEAARETFSQVAIPFGDPPTKIYGDPVAIKSVAALEE